MARILIVDDEKNVRATVSRALELEGHDATGAKNSEEGLAYLDAGGFDLAVVDLAMPGKDGLELLAAMRERGDTTPVIILTAHGTVDRAVSALKQGAFDFLPKPLDRERLLHAVSQALEQVRLRGAIQDLREESDTADGMIGSGPLMDELRERIERAAPSDGRILITGENGTGKELVARAIHQRSSRRENVFVKVNCAAIPEALYESELFGHVKGAFTDARQHHKGRFERAHGGTLFLDEIGEMPLPVQAKLLRVIETGEMERVGGSREIVVDVRLIAASNKQLEREVAQGRFREDLFYRLNVIPIHVPPLREHKRDIPALAGRFLAACCRRNGYPQKVLHPDALDLLKRHDYPGNVRELRNAMERLAVLVPDAEISADSARQILPFARQEAASGTTARAPGALKAQVEGFERQVVLETLERHHWRMAESARALGLERSHLYKKMKTLGIHKPE